MKFKKYLDESTKNYLIFVNERFLQQGIDLMNEAYDLGVKYTQWETSDWIKPVAYEFKPKDLKYFIKIKDFDHFNEGEFQSPDTNVQNALGYVTSMSGGRTPKLTKTIGPKGL